MTSTTALSSSSLANDADTSNTDTSPQKPAPPRNLTQAFDALCVDDEKKEADDECLVVTNQQQHEKEVDDATKPMHPSKLLDVLTLPNDTAVAVTASTTDATNLESQSQCERGVNDQRQNTEQQQQQQQAMISPTGVADLPDSTVSQPTKEKDTETTKDQPFLSLHDDLRRDLSPALVNRVSIYGVIHDINKEATAMAAADVLLQQQQQPIGGDDKDEHKSPIVQAAMRGQVPDANATTSTAEEDISYQDVASKCAVIDEEEWLLSTIANRQDVEDRRNSDTFLQAMGEKEYETSNVMEHMAATTRTQLWKPSRSWWEAKSGKNPWIEPASHNKRWR